MSTLLLAFCLPTPAHAWAVLTNHDGFELHWEQMPVTWRLDPQNAAGLSEAAVHTAVQAAMRAWMDAAPGEVELVDGGSSDLHEAAYDDQNVVFFQDDWDMDPDLVALTANWSRSDDGAMLGFDIRVNSRDHEWSTSGDPEAMDLQNAITHEVGHALGLDHTRADESATMFGSSAPGETGKRDPKWDDRAGIAYLYGDGELPPDPSPVAAGCASTGAGGPHGRKGGPSPASGLVWALPALLALTRRYRGSDG